MFSHNIVALETCLTPNRLHQLKPPCADIASCQTGENYQARPFRVDNQWLEPPRLRRGVGFTCGHILACRLTGQSLVLARWSSTSFSSQIGARQLTVTDSILPAAIRIVRTIKVFKWFQSLRRLFIALVSSAIPVTSSLILMLVVTGLRFGVRS